MRASLSLVLTLALTTSNVAHAGWSRQQRATLREIVALENAGKLEDAVARAEMEVARVDAPSGYRRVVAKRGKAAALKFFERETDPRRIDVRRAVLCSAVKMYRTYQADLIESGEDRLEIPTEVAELEAHAVAVAAPCAPTPPEPATTSSPPPGPETSSSPSFVKPKPGPPPPRLPDRQDRRRVRAGVGTLVPGLVLLAPMAALLAVRAGIRGDLADLADATATRPATEAETTRFALLDDRYGATTAAAAVLGVTGGALIVTGAVLLAAKRRQPRAALAPWGGRGVGGLVLQGRF